MSSLAAASLAQAARATSRTLSNGVKIISAERHRPLSNLGVIVHRGTSAESSKTRGISRALAACAFKGSSLKSWEDTAAEFRRHNAQVSAQAHRDYVAFFADCKRTSSPHVMKLLLENVTCPLMDLDNSDALTVLRRAPDWWTQSRPNPGGLLPGLERQPSAEGPQDDLHDWLAQTPEEFELWERLHTAAYGHEGLGQSLVSGEFGCDLLENPMQTAATWIDPKNITVVSVNADLDPESIVGQFESSGRSSRCTTSASGGGEVSGRDYIGGSITITRPGALWERVIVAHEIPGGARAEIAPALQILEVMLGGGSSFSAGGPGKGLLTHLYTDVLSRYPWVESCEASLTPYNATGLFAISITSDPEFGADATKVLKRQWRQLHLLADDQSAVERGRRQLLSKICEQFENGQALVEILGHGGCDVVGDFLEKVEALGPKDIKRAIEAMSSTRESVANMAVNPSRS